MGKIKGIDRQDRGDGLQDQEVWSIQELKEDEGDEE
jgi:hypothetical protein